MLSGCVMKRLFPSFLSPGDYMYGLRREGLKGFCLLCTGQTREGLPGCVCPVLRQSGLLEMQTLRVAKCLGLDSWLCHHWASHPTSLYLSVFICKMGVIIIAA